MRKVVRCWCGTAMDETEDCYYDFNFGVACEGCAEVMRLDEGIVMEHMSVVDAVNCYGVPYEEDYEDEGLWDDDEYESAKDEENW